MKLNSDIVKKQIPREEVIIFVKKVVKQNLMNSIEKRGS